MARKILIAEDHEQLANSIDRLLERQGYQTLLARDGAEALTAILKEQPDLLLLDLRLPKLHGIELLRKLRQSDKTRELPVVIISGFYKGDKYIRAARALGVEHYLEKPFKASELSASVEAALTGEDPQSTGTPLDQLLGETYLKGFSGRYRLQRGAQVQSLDFINGLPVSLRPGFSVADFGDYLRQRGTISRAEYAYYRQTGYRHASLVEMGCLQYPDLLQEKLAYLTSELIHACDGQPFTTTITPLETPADLQVVAVNLPRILHEAVRRHPGRQARQALLQEHGEHYAATAPAYFSFINFLRLNPAEQALLHRLDGRQRLLELWPAEAEGGQLLILMHRLGMLGFAAEPLNPADPGELPLRALFNADDDEEEIAAEEQLESFADMIADDAGASVPEPVAEPVPAQTNEAGGLAGEVRSFHAELQGKNYYQVFDLQQGDFSFDKLKEHYFAITRRFGPEVLMQLGGEEAEQVQEILATVASAYNTLSDVVKKERYDEMLGRFLDQRNSICVIDRQHYLLTLKDFPISLIYDLCA